ncbi:hypothetical protein [Phaeobacter phage MD18]|nr:hypothetical protein [Phaeobacter phage MD18]
MGSLKDRACAASVPAMIAFICSILPPEACLFEAYLEG